MATANNDFPVLDGIAPSWADIVVKIAATGADLLDTKDVQAINTGTSLEVGEQRRGGRVMKRTTGDVSQEASMTLYREGFDKFLENLATAAESIGAVRGDLRQLALVHFGLQILHTPFGSSRLYEVQLAGCRYMGRNLNGSEGTDADVVEVTLNPIQIVDVANGVRTALL